MREREKAQLPEVYNMINNYKSNKKSPLNIQWGRFFAGVVLYQGFYLRYSLIFFFFPVLIPLTTNTMPATRTIVATAKRI